MNGPADSIRQDNREMTVTERGRRIKEDEEKNQDDGGSPPLSAAAAAAGQLP